jgi:hypothetical protein
MVARKVYLEYKRGYPIMHLADIEWFEELELPIDIPVGAPYIHVVCLCESNHELATLFSPSSFEFVGYDPSQNGFKELPPGPSEIKGLSPAASLSSFKRERTHFFSPGPAPFSRGIIHFIGCNEGTSSEWRNPSTQLNLTMSHRLHLATFNRDNIINIKQGVQTYFGDAKTTPLWFQVDLGANRNLRVTAYCLRHGYNASNSYPQNFKLEGSNDQKAWVQIHYEPGCPFQGPFSARTFNVPTNNSFYRYFRVTQLGNYNMGSPSNPGAAFFCVSGFELYGTLKTTKVPMLTDQAKAKLAMAASTSVSLVSIRSKLTSFLTDKMGLRSSGGSIPIPPPNPSSVSSYTTVQTPPASPSSSSGSDDSWS